MDRKKVHSKEVALRLIRDRIDITGYEIVGVDFRRENLESVNIVNAVFRDCNFQGCNFRRTSVSGTIFVSCNFQAADFTHAKLSQSLWRNCRCERAKFIGTECMKATFIEGSSLCGSIWSVGDYQKREVYVDAAHYEELVNFVKPYVS